MTPPRTQRTAGIALAVASAVTLLASGGEMARRLGAHRESVDTPTWFSREIFEPEFEFLGRPVRIEPVDARPETPDTPGAIDITWDGATARLPVSGADNPKLPKLVRYEDWLRVLQMAAAKGGQSELLEALEKGDVASRLVIVARAPAPDYDPDTWGAARYKDWEYRFLELERGGGIRRWDMTYRDILKRPSGVEFAAAMTVTPGLHTPGVRSSSPISYPNYSGVRDAMGAMGWTWPIAGVSVLTFMIGVLLAAAAGVRREG